MVTKTTLRALAVLLSLSLAAARVDADPPLGSRKATDVVDEILDKSDWLFDCWDYVYALDEARWSGRPAPELPPELVSANEDVSTTQSKAQLVSKSGYCIITIS